jgi:hypothetical protein
MTAKDKAKELVDTYRIMLMLTDTHCGEEILCIVIAKYSALIAVEELMKECWNHREIDLQAGYDYWNSVKQEIEQL